VPLLADNASFRQALAALSGVPRERFVPTMSKRDAYAERPQDISYGQTISDPYIVAVMTASAQLRPGAKVLEIGTGSGYQAAVLARLARSVYSIEIVEPLAIEASERLSRLGYRNITVRSEDGFEGWPEEAPFDAILVTAGAAAPPPPLMEQLAFGGRMVMPIGPTTVQEKLTVFHKSPDGTLSSCILGSVMFVPLRGKGSRSARLPQTFERNPSYCYGEDVGRWAFEIVPPGIDQIGRT